MDSERKTIHFTMPFIQEPILEPNLETDKNTSKKMIILTNSEQKSDKTANNRHLF